MPYYYRRYGPVLTSDKLVFYAVVAIPFYAAGWGMARFASGKATASLMAATTSAVMFLAAWVYWRRCAVCVASRPMGDVKCQAR